MAVQGKSRSTRRALRRVFFTYVSSISQELIGRSYYLFARLAV